MTMYRRTRSFALALALGGLLAPLVACEGDDNPADDGDDSPMADASVQLPPDAMVPPPPPDAAPIPDATPPNTACADDPPPDGDAGVPAMITITGSVGTASQSGVTPIEDAEIVAFKRSDDTALNELVLSDSSGEFGLMVPTNGQPFDGYLQVKAAGQLDSYLFPPDALVADTPAPQVVMISPTLLALLGMIGAEAQPGDGLAFVNLVDCNGDAPTETTLEIVGGDADTFVFDLSMFAGAGVVLILNIPVDKDPETMAPLPTQVTLKAKYGAIDFQPNVIKVFADSITFTQVHP